MIRKNYNKMLTEQVKMFFKILKLMSKTRINKNKKWINKINYKNKKNKKKMKKLIKMNVQSN